jgi:hypothetical protein
MKSKESFISGDFTGMLRNNFLLYPSKFTRESRGQIMDMFGIETSSKRNEKADVPEFISSLPDDQRNKILSIIKQLKNEPIEVNRGIPAGLENLTIR